MFGNGHNLYLIRKYNLKNVVLYLVKIIFLIESICRFGVMVLQCFNI